ncbi:hypothetical protein B0A49_09337 [Cryomyces minteri]|uniref:F-box domain-containing protein n=1 Tax=Cryomyces minteri TaxID=331657 RepID=A0A4U0WGP4_9PEZI|nr:hypothetical protein B0A49_09337 [Cryomyces minteri]
MDASTPSREAANEPANPTLPDDDACQFAFTETMGAQATKLPAPGTSWAKPHNTSVTGQLDEQMNEEASPLSPKAVMSRLLKGKDKEWAAVVEKKGPLQLLDLPVDVLKEIIKEVTHTNDLTSLALCHSALHNLTIEHIYSRFDIVWPDSTNHAEPRAGVDALTYGLATLVMAEEIFGEAPSQRPRLHSPSQSISNTNASQETLQLARATDAQIRRRRGNHYAQFTRKFSLGNGPPDWVSEYLIHKEGGKMLGTLVALAVARMRSLETFVWDMPTGVLRDVWLALSSLGDRHDGQDCRLERIWIRWHNNSSQDSGGPIHPPPLPQSTIPPPPPPPPHATGLAHLPIPVPAHHNVPSALATDRVESPTFSVLPPLKSLSVLDIDELPYLDEMSVLIGRSQSRLRELRVGIARQARQRDWVTAWEGHSIQQVETGTSGSAGGALNEKRLGGVLGVLVGHVYDMREDASLADKATKTTAKTARPTPLEQPSNAEATPPDPPVLPTATEIRAPDEHGGDLISFAATSGITGLPEFTPTQVPHADVPEWQADNADYRLRTRRR